MGFKKLFSRKIKSERKKELEEFMKKADDLAKEYGFKFHAYLEMTEFGIRPNIRIADVGRQKSKSSLILPDYINKTDDRH